MDNSLILRGFIIGLSVAAPVGPMAVLCIRRTLAQGMSAGLISGLGIAAADAAYALVGGLGLTLISDFLVGQQFWFRLIGGIFLVYLGVKTLMAKPATEAAKSVEKSGAFGLFLSTFLLTMTNPTTILSFAAIFAGLGLGAGDDKVAALILVNCVFAGSALWWLVLTTGVSLLRSRITPGVLIWVNRISGVVILGFALYALLGIFG
jgi:threonine/homoserine/homoserine lactone efflux protein